MNHRPRFIQDSANAALSGLPFLTIDATPQSLEERAGLTWALEDNELGPSLLTRLRLGRTGPRFSLRFFPDAQHPGIVVSGDAEATDDEIDALLAFLGVAQEEIIDQIPVPAVGKQSDRGSQRRRKGVDAAQSERQRSGFSKAALIDAIAADSGLSKADANRAIESFVGTVGKTLKKGDEVVISGFGKFSVVKRTARQGVNPRTGEKVMIKAKKAPKFTAGADLKRIVHGRK